MDFAQLSAAFILQLAVILGTCRLTGWLVKRLLGQPQVVGDMIAGILAQGIRARMEPITVILLVPLFFTFSGLNTQLAMVDRPSLAIVALVILTGSILAKGGACWAAARLTGQDNPTVLAVGALMTIVTTIMTSPAIDIIARRKRIGDTRADMPHAPCRTSPAERRFHLSTRRPNSLHPPPSGSPVNACRP